MHFHCTIFSAFSTVFPTSSSICFKDYHGALVAQVVALQASEQEVWGSIPESIPVEIFLSTFITTLLAWISPQTDGPVKKFL